MSAITFKSKGDFKKAIEWFGQTKEVVHNLTALDRYGKEGVDALASATPYDTGNTARSWSYKITRTNGSVKLSFHNSNIQNGVPIAILLQYGHATKNGGYVQGRDYINPAIQPIFDRMAEDMWKEVTKT